MNRIAQKENGKISGRVLFVCAAIVVVALGAGIGLHLTRGMRHTPAQNTSDIPHSPVPSMEEREAILEQLSRSALGTGSTSTAQVTSPASDAVVQARHEQLDTISQESETSGMSTSEKLDVLNSLGK